MYNSRTLQLCSILVVSSARVQRFDDHCYKISSNGVFKSWTSASESCANMGMKLATVESTGELSFLQSMISSSGSKCFLWSVR